MSDTDPDADLITVAEEQLFNVLLMLFQLRLRATAEDRIRRLEDAAGRDLPEVRGQLARLLGADQLPLPEANPADESTAMTAVKRARGRPPKFPSGPSSPNPIQPQ